MLSAATLTSFDGTEAVTTRVARPERYRDLLQLLQEGPLIARGAGLSYSAASMGAGGTSVDMTRFNRLLAFDADNGTVTVEAGARVGALTEFLIARGYYLPVLPGYPDITVGGCIAFDVHGKSQHHTGNFSEAVVSFVLAHPDHGELTVSRETQPELFDLTLGSFGSTGIVLSATLRVKPLPGPGLVVEALPAPDLRSAVDVMQRRAGELDGLYSWHDFNRGSRFGAGVVFAERFVQDKPALRLSKPRFPGRRHRVRLWNTLSTRLALSAYAVLQRVRSRRLLDVRRAMFPIEGLEGYYAAFGRGGFREYQLIVPYATWDALSRELESVTRRSRVPITLASLKLFRGRPRNLSFSGEGVCVAIDVPESPAALRYFAELDALCGRHGAVVNLSKDSRIGGEACRALFPDFSAFQSRLLAWDPKRRFCSRLRERIDL
jgi:decaprenylphospho-beta-D-ribofuranose 2-oxidase